MVALEWEVCGLCGARLNDKLEFWIIDSVFLAPSSCMAGSTYPSDGSLRKYWLLIQSAASKVRRHGELIDTGCTSVFPGAGALLGTLLAPGIGTLIGGGVGILIGAIHAVSSAEKRKQKRYSYALRLSSQGGFKYATYLYNLFGECLSESQLRQYLAGLLEEDEKTELQAWFAR